MLQQQGPRADVRAQPRWLSLLLAVGFTVARAATGASTDAQAAAAPTPRSVTINVPEGLSFWGYGEIYYTDPIYDAKQAQADLARAVFGFGYQFDELTQFNSEYEVEHGVASASDVGEFEVEQFYVDRQLTSQLTLRGGLMLMPFGFINEHHEPTNFYGVQRDFVETLIIPSTWREGGLQLRGNNDLGIDWAVGITTGFDLSKWSYTPEFPTYTNALLMEDNDVAPLQTTHQELALANAQNPAAHVSLNYAGVPGLLAGAAFFSGDAVKVPAPPNAQIPGTERVTLWEAHARWQPGRFDLWSIYAHGAISNLTLANAANPGSPNPIPSAFYGYYAQGVYHLWEHGSYRLHPFVRYEYYNMGSRYEGTKGPVTPGGLTPLSATPGDYGYWPINSDHVVTTGVNFYLNPHLVVKGDYQHFDTNHDFTRVDLGMGINY